MGVDYYVITRLVVTFTDDEKSYIELCRQGHYYYYSMADYDSDSEGAKQRADEENNRQRQAELDKYADKKILYENGIWKITSQDKIKEYTNLVVKKPTYNPHNWEDVVSIVKRTFAEER